MDIRDRTDAFLQGAQTIYTVLQARRSRSSRSKIVLEAYARQNLHDMLRWAFAHPDRRQSDEDRARMYSAILPAVSLTDPFWIAGLGPPEDDDLEAAFATIRQIATAVAKGEEVRIPPMHVEVLLTGQSEEYGTGRPQFHLDGRFRDALVWTTVRLFEQVPRSLIRRCAFQGCPHVMVASRNQRHCADHGKEAARLVQRRAEKAFHARQRQRKNKSKKRRKA